MTRFINYHISLNRRSPFDPSTGSGQAALCDQYKKLTNYVMKVLVWILVMGICSMTSNGQSMVRSIEGIDSGYVMAFARKNDIRMHFTSQRYLLQYGSTKEGNTESGLFSNVTELLGGGLTYKFIDLDLAFSLPNSRVISTGVQNLSQFRLSGTYSARRWTVRGYWLQSTGLVAADASGQFISGPSVDVLNIGLPFTWYFNFRKYSFRAPAFKNELQRRSAGSLLLRLEPFFRRLGVGTPLVPPGEDSPSKYGEQAGLKYVHAPGFVLQPGYGYTWVGNDGRWFIAPMAFTGLGLAINDYKGNGGGKTKLNVEWKGSATLSAGYNGPRWYASLRSSYEVNYFLLDPSYFLTTDLKLVFTVGYRFNAFEKFLPETLF